MTTPSLRFRPTLFGAAGAGFKDDLTVNDGVHLRWDPRREEGFVRARVERNGWLGRRVLGTSEDGHFVDREVDPGGSYRYVAVLERAGAEPAPASQPVAVRIPERADFN